MKINSDFVVLFVGRLVQSLVAIVSVRFMTTFLDKDNVGYNYLIASIISYFSLIFINPVGMYINRHLHEWHRKDLLYFRFKQLNSYFLLISLISIPVVVFASTVMGVGRGLPLLPLASLVFLNIFFSTWFQTLGPGLNMLEHRKAFVGTNLLSQFLGILFGIAFVKLISADVIWWLLGFLAGQTLSAIVAWVYFKKKVFTQQSYQAKASEQFLFFKRDLWFFCLPIAVTTIFMWTQNHSYRLIVESKLGPDFLAEIALGLGVAASLASVVESLMSQYFYPRYYQLISNADEMSRARAWNLLFRNAMSVFIPSIFLCVVCAKYLMKFLVAAKFHETYTILMLGLGVELSRMITNVVYVVSQSEKNTKSTILPYVFGSATVLLLIYLIVGNYFDISKETSVPIALFLAGIITCLVMYISMKKILNIHFDLIFVLKTLIYCLPLLAILGTYSTEFNIFVEGGICIISGFYTIAVMWVIQKKLRETNSAI